MKQEAVLRDIRFNFRIKKERCSNVGVICTNKKYIRTAQCVGLIGSLGRDKEEVIGKLTINTFRTQNVES